MTNEEQVLAAIEEISNQLNDIKKTINRPTNNVEVDLTPISNRLDNMKENLQKLGYASISRESEFNRITESLRDLRNILSIKQNEVLHRYIEVKQPHKWVIGIAAFFILSISICSLLVYRNVTLSERLENAQANDFKYRFLKLKNFEINELRREIDNTYDLTMSIDAYYKKKTQEVRDYVIKREEEINRVNEATEIARQKELEAKEALEEAKKIKSKYSGESQTH